MATRRFFLAMAQRSYLISRHAAAQSLDSLHQMPARGAGSILGTSYVPFASSRPFSAYKSVNGVTCLLFRRYLATSPKGMISEDEEDAESSSEDDMDPSKDVEDLNARVYRSELGPEEAQQADEIGYRIVGPAKTGERPAKPKEPIFAVIQVGSHQFKVCSGDRIVVEKLKFADVNQKILLNKVLMLGTKSQTIIGRPILPNAAVYALVEEQALGAEVIIFKKKRRKNYRRMNYHRQELTRLRIYDIKGLEESLVETAIAA
uniref:Large ribosomal subunit protein bL21m n=2 Tax=Araucaria cunninghamii TaxID=56994 RepID=A0A0D6R5R0_ARACU